MKQAFILLITLSILLAACGQPAPEAQPGAVDTAVAQTFAALPTDTQAPTATQLPTNTTEPTATATPEFTFPAGAECVPESTEIQQGLVTHVVDGDTIDVDIDGQVYRVRYIGMDTPENTSQVEYFGVESTIRNSQLVDGKTVVLVKDVSQTDRYDRLLRYVFVDDIFVNLDLVESGFATAATYPPDVACADTFVAAEQTARSNGVGLWAATPTSPPTNTPIPQPTSTPRPTQPPPPPTKAPQPTKPPAQSNCDPSYPDVCIPPKPPDLDCKDIPYRRFRVLPPDPHNFDGDGDGIGCES